MPEGIEVRVSPARVYIARSAPDVVKIVHTLVDIRDSIPLQQTPNASFDKLTAIYSAKQAAERVKESVKGSRFLVAVVGRVAAPRTEGGLYHNEVEIEAAHRAGVPVLVFGVPDDYYTLQGQPGGVLNESLPKRLSSDKRVRFVELPATWDEIYECMHREVLRMLGGPHTVTHVETPAPATQTQVANPQESNERLGRISGAGTGPVSMGMLADRALEGASDDRLAFADYANGVWAVVDSLATQTPLVMALNAPWGAGKSSISRMVKERFDATRSENDAPPHRAMIFNAWQYDHEDGLTVSFVRQIAQFVDRHRSFWQRVRRPLPLGLMDAHRKWRVLLLRVGWLAIVAPLAVWLLLANSSLGDGLVALVVGVGITTSIGAVFWLSKATLDGLAAFARNPSAEAERGSMERVRSQLGQLIAQARPSEQAKFVILVDDLERCRPPHAVDILEVVSQLLDHRGVVVLLMGDMSIVAANVEVKYRELAERFVPEDKVAVDLEDRSKTFGNRYLQKIVQLQFDVPRLRSWRVAQFAEELAGNVPVAPPTTDKATTAPSNSVWLWRPNPVRALTADSLRRQLLTRSLLSMGVVIVAIAAGVFFEHREILADRRFELWFSISVAVLAGIAVQVASVLLWRREGNVLRSVDQALRQAQDSIANARGPPAKISEQWKTFADANWSLYVTNQLAGQLFAKFTRKSEAFEQAYRAGLPYLPPYPRSVKRYLNRLRLLLFIAAARNLFALGVLPAQFGKWAALHERWPELGRKFTLGPSELPRLEQMAAEGNKEALEKAINALSAGHGTDAVLRQFLADGPSLGPVSELLVHLDADRPPNAKGA